MSLSSRFLTHWAGLLFLAATFPIFPLHAATINHDTTMAPVLPGPFPVACSNFALDTGRLGQLGGVIDDFWQGKNSHYVTDILLEPADTLKTSPRIPDEGLYPRRRNSVVDFVVIACYPTDATNQRPDYLLPEGQRIPRMQRAGQSAILPDRPCNSAGAAPASCGRWPLLVLSHGIGLSPVDSRTLDVLVRLAGYGYIVAAPFHGDERFLRLQLGDLGDLVYLLRNFDEFVELQALRPLAVKSVVDLMLTHADFKSRIDAERIGGIGISLGGETMTLLLGARVTDDYWSETSSPTVTDPRIKAAVGYIPYAGQKYLSAFGKDNATAGNVSVPYLAISGTEDGTAPMYRMEEAINRFRGTRYQVALGGVGHTYLSGYADDVFGWVVPFFSVYLKGPDYSSDLDRLVRQQNVRGGIDDQLRISYELQTIELNQGWNLLGNGSDAPIDVAATFSDANRFASVWKWIAERGTWAFYAPSLAANGGIALANYASAKGYQLLTTIAGGEGYWVNAKQAASINLPLGRLLGPTAFQAGLTSPLKAGWNLVSIGTRNTPAGFNVAVGTSLPAAGAVPLNITSLWAWDISRSNWYFYAPSLEAQGGSRLGDYVADQGYLDFSAANKTLGLGVGFWVHRP